MHPICFSCGGLISEVICTLVQVPNLSFERKIWISCVPYHYRKGWKFKLSAQGGDFTPFLEEQPETKYLLRLMILTLFLPGEGGISPYMNVTWPLWLGIGLKDDWISNRMKKIFISNFKNSLWTATIVWSGKVPRTQGLQVNTLHKIINVCAICDDTPFCIQY